MKQKNTKKIEYVVNIFLAMVVLGGSSLFAQSNGKISGIVIDKVTKQPLIGTNVLISDTYLGSSTDNEGNFTISEIPTGDYQIEFRYIGYQALIKTDIIVRPGRITRINAELTETVMEGETVIVQAAYFQKEEDAPVSSINFSNEEIRRAPGSAGDISRVLNAVPGVAQQSDQFNDLMVRGGSPIENGYYLDNIPIPNINHFPVLGATGGAIGILNTDFISNVNFYTGGFSSAYGDRLSSIMDIEYREGARESINWQIDFNFSGFGGQGEGPIFGEKGSWLLSAKRSYLDIIQKAIQTEGETPRFGDIQGKFSYDINPQNKITTLFIYAPSSRADVKADAEEEGRTWYTENWEALQNTVGINWRYLWSKKGYSNTSISFNQTNGDGIDRFLPGEAVKRSNSYTEGAYTFRNRNSYKFDKLHKLDFGFEAKTMFVEYDYFFAADTNELGYLSPELSIKKDYNSQQFSAFGSFIWNPFPWLTTTIGLRGDYSDFNDLFNLSPRISTSWNVNKQLTLNFSRGEFYQSVPLFLISQSKSNEDLKNLRSTHSIAGLDYMLSEDTKMTLEIYSKEYTDFPLSKAYPYLFVLDQGTNWQSFSSYGELESIGESWSRGIDLLIQKKMASDFYGIMGISYFRSRYKDYNDKARDRQFDNKFLFNVIGGYKPNNTWEASIRWNYAGGQPYTPFDMDKSREFTKGIYDLSKVNAERMPVYHSLNFRIDRRFHMRESSVVAYLSVWNLYNRKNIALYLWDEDKNDVKTFYQWSFLPIIGIEYEL